MELRSYSRFDIAVSQINTAIDLYSSRQDYFSAITLAGAGEEILGRLLERHQKDNALKKNAEALIVIHQEINKKRPEMKEVINSLNEARNSMKHINKTGDLNCVMDPAFEAEAMIYRAIENYYALTGFFTPKMEIFYRDVFLKK